jgi:tRNA 2-thiocytidine biosynthesis protein TtcA
MQRQAIKQMLAAWEEQHPGRSESIFSALRAVEPAHLADPRLFDFAGLRAQLPVAETSGAEQPDWDALAERELFHGQPA